MNSCCFTTQTSKGGVMEKYSGFVDIDDELKWYAVVMSQGNIEAVSQFASYRNEMRTKNKKDNAEKEGTDKERNV